ncbi:MAG: polysaccharide export protein [Phycisphaerae bacterium]|nr:polysaccharide export protein [Phycisphaerae bacterium]
MKHISTNATCQAWTRVASVELCSTRHNDRHGRRMPVVMKVVSVAAAIFLSLLLTGCGPRHEQSDTEISAFEKAGPVRLDVECKQALSVRMPSGPYRFVPGDLVDLQMPAIVSLLQDRDGDDTKPYRCRVDSAGRIVLPIIGNREVAGKTLSEVEADIANLYYPKYVRKEPSIVVSVVEYRLSSISVAGAVKCPGVYQFHSNEMTLVAAIMKAGGIVEDGATAIHISVTDSISDGKRLRTIPVLNMNIPAGDVQLADGDTIIVEAMEPRTVSVVGLVNNPGSFPWRPKVRCTVMDALAFAGGVNDLADPQYTRVYRQDAGGEIVSLLIRLNGPSAAGAGKIYLKPGDIVAVEQTPRTRTRLFLSQIIRMGLGVNAGASVGGP